MTFKLIMGHTHRCQLAFLKKKKKNQVKSPSHESRVPKTGSDSPIGSSRDSGRDTGGYRAYRNGGKGVVAPNRVAICSGANYERGLSLPSSFRIRCLVLLIARLDW